MSRIDALLRKLRLPNSAEITAHIKDWLQNNGPWWATSAMAHAVILSTALLVLGSFSPPKPEGEAVALESSRVDTEIKEEELKDFDLGQAPVETTELTTDTLSMSEQVAQDEQINTTEADPFEEAGGGTSIAADSRGGLGGFEVRAMNLGPKVTGDGGVGGGKGFGNQPGSGGAGAGFGGRGSGVRKAMLGRYGGTKGSERAVAAGLFWLSRHQNPDGSWSLNGFQKRCKDGSCTGNATIASDGAATALSLLPFFAAGQTHKSKGPYQKNIQAGLYWMIAHQGKDGNLCPGGAHIMYTHGLAAICMCEAYGLSNDPQVRASAQQAVYFIEKAQGADGGWRYSPGEDGDTSVVGWQVMALKSAQMAGLSVSTSVLDNAKKYLKSASQSAGGLFAYQPGGPATSSMTAVGLLCTQYLGSQRTDPAMQEGIRYLMNYLPDGSSTSKPFNIYYWYYATQVLHNLPGSEWDTWNRKMRKVLIDSQSKTGCAAGSWDPTDHTHGDHGGRIMVTALSCLTLEVYYRYLPLYQLDSQEKKTAQK